MERNRLKKIDQALGTNTYFYDVKPYEERVNSNHIMEVRIAKA
jgi:hypothetical protein